MGILFPLGVRIYAQDIDRIGAKAGNTFFSNTLGCVLGSLLTGFVLIPFIGMWNTTLLLINLSLLIALAFLLRNGPSSRQGAMGRAGCGRGRCERAWCSRTARPSMPN